MPKPDQSQVEEVSPEAYAAFVEQIELHSVWLAHSSATNYAGPLTPPNAVISIEMSVDTRRFVNLDGGFDAFMSYKLAFRSQGESNAAAEMTVIFGLRFTSQQPMTPALFDVFAELNLPVNSWPFLREFVQSMLARMSWAPFTLPTYKVGTSESASDNRE